MVIKCAIVDDRMNDCQIIRNTIEHLCYGTDIIINCLSFREPKDPEILNPFDLYILDIDMPDINGFELAKTIYEKSPRAVIVFCTMHDNLVFDSFKLNAFYFVRKQYLEDDLSYTLKKLVSRYRMTDAYIAKTKDGIERIPLSDIVYFEVAHNDLYIHMNDSTERKERKTLNNVSQELSTSGFVLVSKSFLVNLKYVSKINDRQLLLYNGQIIPISKSQTDKVKQKFMLYNMRNPYV